MPIGFKPVINNHWNYSIRLKRVLFLYRDGRDLAKSTSFILGLLCYTPVIRGSRIIILNGIVFYSKQKGTV